jgi:hypothetical protein
LDQQPEFAPFGVEYLHGRLVGGHQINGSVEDALINSAVGAFANEQGTDLLKSQHDLGVRP